jgi:hypothetical protein
MRPGTHFQHLEAEAGRHLRARRWESAARSFADLARLLEAEGRTESASGALGAAGDAAFRADLPFEALRLFRRSLALCENGPTESSIAVVAALRKVQMAGVLVETGDLGAAEQLLREIEGLPLGPRLACLGRDVQISLWLLRGCTSRARTVLGEMAEQLPDGARAVLHFRSGQLHGAEGHFREALEDLSLCLDVMGDRPEMDGPRGAALLEMAETALLRDEATTAFSLLQAAQEAWTRARRRSGVLRVDATRMRLLVRTPGCEVVATGLDRAIAFAQERGLLPLELELRLAAAVCGAAGPRQGQALGGPGGRRLAPVQLGSDLRQIALDAAAIGARVLGGRARLLAAKIVRGTAFVGDGSGDPASDGVAASLEEALCELRETEPWYSLAMQELARVLSTECAHLERADRLEVESRRRLCEMFPPKAP